MTNYINIKKIIDVSTTLPLVSQARRDFSKAIFIQQGTAYTNGEVRSYTSAADIATDLGSNCEAYKAALKYFSGGFNGILPTQLSVGLVKTSEAVASTQGAFTTGSMTGNLAGLIAVTDGSFKIAVDGAAAITIAGLDFTSATTFAEIASILSETPDIKNLGVTVVDSGSDTFIFTSSTYGTTSDVVITAATSGTNLTGATYFNGGAAVVGTTGTQAATINLFLANSSYYHIMLSNQFSEADAMEWSTAVEAATKVTYALWIQTATTNVKSTTILTDPGTIALKAFNTKLKKTWIVYADSLTNYTQASFASYFGIVDFTEARPLGCLAFKQFSGAITSDLTDSNFDNLFAKNVNFYGVYGESGRNIAYGGKAPNGNFINDIIFADWADYNMTYDIFDWTLKKTKIRYTSADFAELAQVIEQTPVAALGFGAIAGGTDPDTGENLMNGYKITIPTPDSISSTDKSQGLLKNIQVVMLLSGNIIKIVITNTLKI